MPAFPGKLHGKGLLDQALSKLEEAERLADGYMLNPFNAKAATGRGLQKANKSFKEAVFSFIRQVGELTKEIETAAEGDSTIVVANVVKPLKHLSTIFDPEKFDDTVDKVKGAETLTDVRVFKEQGLRFVRMYQDRLDKDPVLRLLGEGTPFQAQARIAPLRESLTGLELNFLRADAI